MPRKNILLLQSDEHSYRFLSARPREKGGETCHTPTLDSLIAEGAHFESAYCQMPLCTPSRISMLTGRHSHRCGAWGNASVLPPELPTIGSHFRQNGYATATIGKMHLGGSLQTAGFGDRPYGDFGGPCAHQPDPLARSRMSLLSFLAPGLFTMFVGFTGDTRFGILGIVLVLLAGLLLMLPVKPKQSQIE